MFDVKDISSELRLIFNNQIIKNVKVEDVSLVGFDNVYELETLSSEAVRLLTEFNINDFKRFRKLILNDWQLIQDFYWIVEIEFAYLAARFTPTTKFRFVPNLVHWKKNYNFAEFREVFSDLLKVNKTFPDSEIIELNTDSNESDEIIFLVYPTYEKNFENLSIKEGLKNYESVFNNIYLETTKLLENSKSVKTVLTLFNFPENTKVACEQYLLYFAQFLQDLGIDATSNLKEEAGKVLFSVMPIGDVEALDKIREALAVYLNLPSSPIVYDESFAAMRLKQQVDNLQHAQRMTEMEFRLAQKVIESQDKIIQQKDLTIEQQSKVIEMIMDKAVMINSAENKEELEKIFDGVKVGKSKFLAEQIGLHLNPATALKSVGKKLTGKDGEIILLNLNDEIESKDI